MQREIRIRLIVDDDHFVLDCRGKMLDCRPGSGEGARVMGILNVTPDSFYDGGAYESTDAALRRCEEMLREGAAVIDIGGDSSRPRGSVYGEGARGVSASEEQSRVLPVVEAVRRHFPEAVISVDTWKPSVARAVLEAGCHMINDITGLRHRPGMAKVAARYGAPLVVMHAVGRPGCLVHEFFHADPVGSVRSSLEASLRLAEKAGVRHVVLDPGFGFGKTPEQNLMLINRLDRFLALGRPLLVGISRKSTIGVVLGRRSAPVGIHGRLFGTLGATAVAVMRGATLVRTHDVRPTVEMLRAIGETVA